VEQQPVEPQATPVLHKAEPGKADNTEAKGTPEIPGKGTGDGEISMARVTAGFAVTSGIRYLLGSLASSRFLMSAVNLTPGVGIAAIMGVSLLEAGMSIAAFQAIAGIETNQHQAAAFILSAVTSSLLAPLLLSPLGPIGGVAAAIATNAIRLVLFNLIARGEGEPLDLTISPLTALGDKKEGVGVKEEKPVASVVVPRELELLTNLKLSELEKLTEVRYQELTGSSGSLESGKFESYLQARRSLDAAIQRSRQ
jgi:hypothetical protein